MSVFSILQLLFSHKDSLEKWWWQASWTTIARRHVLHSRMRILLKSRDDRGAQRSWLKYIFCILAQGFFAKVAKEVPSKRQCALHLLWKIFPSSLRIYTHFWRWVMLVSRRRLWVSSACNTYFAFSHKDSLQKSRRKVLQNGHVRFTCSERYLMLS